MVEATKDEIEARKKKLEEEEQKKLDQEQIDKAKETPEKDLPEEPEDKIDRTNAAATRLEAANKKKEELLIQEERLKVDNALGGQSEISDKPTAEDKAKEAAKALLPEGVECPGVTD